MRAGLDGQVALVTGAVGGLGRVCCRLLARDGAQVVVSDLDGDGLEAVRSECGGALALAADVTDASECSALVDEAFARLGRLDVVVTAAGLYHATPTEAIESEEWDRIQSVNVRGTFSTVQAAFRVMLPRRRGAVVTIGSVAGQMGGVRSGAGYAASKAGVIGLTKALARHAGPYGIRVNCVNPGFIEAGMSLGLSAADRDRTIAATPLGRAGTAEEVAEAVVWLASEAASFVTGTQLDVNGGLLMA